MHRKNKLFIGFFMIFCAVLFYGSPAMATDFPTRSINMIVPWSAGGAGDTIARTLADVAKNELGQPVVVENKPGAGGSLGTTLVLNKTPDGYTIGDTSTMTQMVSYYTGILKYHPVKDVTHIMRVAGMLYGLTVRIDSKFKTLKDFIEYSKANPQKIALGVPGLTSAPRLAMEELSSMAGDLKWTLIPLKGESDTNASLLGGHVDAVANSGWVPLVNAGKFRALALFSSKRNPRFPDVPTLKESGYDVVWEAPVGIFGPKGIPKPVVIKLQDAFRKGMDSPAFLKAMKTREMPLMYLNAEDTQKAVLQESKRIEMLVKKLGLEKK